MKKILVTISMILLAIGLTFAQNIFENEFYLKSLEYRQMADKAYADGDYEQAYSFALKAEEYAGLSDQYIAKMKAMYQANAKLSAAQRRIDYANAIKLVSFHPSLYEEAVQTFASAEELYKNENYEEALAQAQAVIDLLVGITPQGTKIAQEPEGDSSTTSSNTASSSSATSNTNVAPIVQLLPKYYTVRLIPERRDCFHRIAEYAFVYADPYKWEILYNKNKHLLVDPNNPHLIHPGQVFEIPSIKGESRDGMYDPEIDYPSINDLD